MQGIPKTSLLQTSVLTPTSYTRCLSSLSNLTSSYLSQGQKSPSDNVIPSNGLCAPQNMIKQFVRNKNIGMRVYYQGKPWKRYNVSNIEKRLQTDGGLEVLWRKTLRGQRQLATFQRILPDHPLVKKNGTIVKPSNLKFEDHPRSNYRLPDRKMWYLEKFR